ncbi:UNVERIFIED_CONTAM: Carboxyl-terminal-processing peptidase 1, chloroplastic [Sesamum latifolium]|uniref:Carboxyl-terminal-processing peptidase 1, chloroplastic n=1 Tax=Sesamum latifolium TaxID=2727402 RepID=A0AAW2WLZ2_9LAMI
MVRLLLCNSSSSPSSLPPPPPLIPTKSVSVSRPLNNITRSPEPNYTQKTVSITQALSTTLLSAALSLGIFCASPSEVISLELSAPQEELNCREDENYENDKVAANVVTNEEIVEEAWQIVNDSFLDTGRRRWSPDYWLKKKGDILGTSIQTRSRAHEIIRRMLASLGDPYTRFLSPAEGDELLSINGVGVKGKSAFEASSMLQGPSETFVDIKVKHGNCGPVQSIRVQRQSIAKSPVFYRLEQVKNSSSPVGYVRLKEFNALARKDMLTAMRRLQDMGASYFVLDLRDNLGGLVQVTYTVGRDPLSVKNIVAETSPLFSAPIIVLVNKNTASASEIGLIQSVFELNDGSGVVVTIGKYVTPKHMDINGNGVDPDFRNLPGHGNCKYASSTSTPTITPPSTPTVPMTPPSTTTPINPYSPGGNGYGSEPGTGYDYGSGPTEISKFGYHLQMRYQLHGSFQAMQILRQRILYDTNLKALTV